MQALKSMRFCFKCNTDTAGKSYVETVFSEWGLKWGRLSHPGKIREIKAKGLKQ